jgi:hypothetical protein
MKKSKNKKKKKKPQVKRESQVTPGKKGKLRRQQVAYSIVIFGNLVSVALLFLPYIYINNEPVTAFSLMNLHIISIPSLSLSMLFAILGLILKKNYAWGCVAGIFGGAAEHFALHINYSIISVVTQGMSIGIGSILLSLGAIISMIGCLVILIDEHPAREKP